MTMPIDFVVLWVDGADPCWQQAKEQRRQTTSQEAVTAAKEVSRYRDWDLFHFWFRGVEQFAPWVRKVHLVTDHQVPDWLNTDHPKLQLVFHDHFLQPENLPTFNSRAIEVNLHKIPDLSEQFVYFNDDTFLIRPVSEKDFFLNGLPRDSAIFAPVRCKKGGTGAVQSNNLEIINEYFNKQQALRSKPDKWWNPCYGMQIFRTISLIYYKDFMGFLETHLPVSYRKKTFTDIWEREPEILNLTSAHPFKSKLDVNQWLFRSWQLASGTFSPRSLKIGKFYGLGETNAVACQAITEQKYPLICLNDQEHLQNETAIRAELQAAFSTILPNRSTFEISKYD